MTAIALYDGPDGGEAHTPVSARSMEDSPAVSFAVAPSPHRRSCLKHAGSAQASPRNGSNSNVVRPLPHPDPYKNTYFRRMLESLALEHERKVMQLEELQKANENLMRKLHCGENQSGRMRDEMHPGLFPPPPPPVDAQRPPTADLAGQLLEEIQGAFGEATPPNVPTSPVASNELPIRRRVPDAGGGGLMSPQLSTASKSRRSGAKVGFSHDNQKPRLSNGPNGSSLMPPEQSSQSLTPPEQGTGSASLRIVATPTIDSNDDDHDFSATDKLNEGRNPLMNQEKSHASNLTHQNTGSSAEITIFRLRPQYRGGSGKGSIKQEGLAHADTKHFGDEDDMIVAKTRGGLLVQFISQPGSPRRLWWDLLGAILIVYDIVSIPLLVFQESSENMFTAVMQWVTLFFWTLNVVASFQVGYVHRGVTIVAPHKIAWNYLKTWFFLDMIILLPEWSFMFICLGQSCSNATDSVRLFRGLRIARCLRLVRLLKMKWVFQLLDEYTDSEYTSIIASICKMIIMLLVLNHCIACAWFGLADALQGKHNTWVLSHGVLDEDWGTQYLTSFHWSITQFTPASMDVQPHNEYERAFAVTVIVFALVGFSYVVGSITGSLAQLRSLQEAMSKQFWTLKRYLRQNNVPARLSKRIQNYVLHAWKLQAMGSSAANVKMLDLLSDQLRKELKSAIYVQHLLIHPLLNFMNNKANIVLHRLAETAIMRKQLAARDSLFFKGEAAFCMYFIVTGRLEYKRMNAYTYQELKEFVDSGEDWISEPVLWSSDWVHVGTCSAITHCDLLQVVATDCADVFRQNPTVKALVTMYASNFMMWLNDLTEEKINDICQGELDSELIESFIPPMEEPATPKGLMKRERSVFKIRTNTVQTLMSSALSSRGTHSAVSRHH